MTYHRMRRDRRVTPPPPFIEKHARDRRLRRGDALIMEVKIPVSTALTTDLHLPPDAVRGILDNEAHRAVRVRMEGQRTPYIYDLHLVRVQASAIRDVSTYHYRAVIRAAQGDRV